MLLINNKKKLKKKMNLYTISILRETAMFVYQGISRDIYTHDSKVPTTLQEPSILFQWFVHSQIN